MNKAEDGEGSVLIALRVPVNLLKSIDKIVKKRGYISRSDFIRDAIRKRVNEEL